MKKSQLIISVDTEQTVKREEVILKVEREKRYIHKSADLPAKTLKEIMGWYSQGTKNQIKKKKKHKNSIPSKAIL